MLWNYGHSALKDVDMRKITLTNALGGAAMLCGGIWCLLILYLFATCFIGVKSLDVLLLLFLMLPVCTFALFGIMSINRGRALIKMKTKGNIISTVEVLSVLGGVLLVVLMTVTGSSVFQGIISLIIIIVATIVFGISAYVFGCRFVLRKEGFEFNKGELVGKNLADFIAYIVFFSCFGTFSNVSEWWKSGANLGITFVVVLIPIFIAYGVNRLCYWGFKRI